MLLPFVFFCFAILDSVCSILSPPSWLYANFSLSAVKAAVFTEVTEKGVIPVLDAGIHLRKSLCCKEIYYRVKNDNSNFRSFSATLSSQAGIPVISEIISAVSLARLKGE